MKGFAEASSPWSFKQQLCQVAVMALPLDGQERCTAGRHPLIEERDAADVPELKKN